MGRGNSREGKGGVTFAAGVRPGASARGGTPLVRTPADAAALAAGTSRGRSGG